MQFSSSCIKSCFRCVVSSLTEEGPNDLAEELVRGEAVQVNENTPIDEDDENWDTWIPDPVDAIPSMLKEKPLHVNLNYKWYFYR